VESFTTYLGGWTVLITLKKISLPLSFLLYNKLFNWLTTFSPIVFRKISVKRKRFDNIDKNLLFDAIFFSNVIKFSRIGKSLNAILLLVIWYSIHWSMSHFKLLEVIRLNRYQTTFILLSQWSYVGRSEEHRVPLIKGHIWWHIPSMLKFLIIESHVPIQEHMLWSLSSTLIHSLYHIFERGCSRVFLKDLWLALEHVHVHNYMFYILKLYILNQINKLLNSDIGRSHVLGCY
jgi:hypothetical protein